MKILWFANTPCGSSGKLDPNLNIGGWLNSLEEELVMSENVELSICFYWNEKLDSFKFKKTIYYPIFRTGNGSKSRRLINRALNVNNDKNEIQQLLKVIELVKPDVIHVHGTEYNFGLIQAHTNIPIVISIQGIISPYREKYFSGIPFLAAIWHEGLMAKLLFLSVIVWYNEMKRSGLRERTILSQARFIIGRTDWDRRVTRVLAPKSRYFIGNEMLRSTFYENQWNKNQFGNPIQIVTIMSGGLYKGLETIVKTATILKEYNIKDFDWTIIGQDEKSDLVKIVKGWLKTDFKSIDVRLVGNKNEKELVELLLKSDIYCQVSHIENSPNSLCEAMLLGMPIIASFAGGTDSILESRKEGLLVQDGDSYSLAGAILEMGEDYNKAAEMGRLARVRALERHNKELILNEILTIYNSIL